MQMAFFAWLSRYPKIDKLTWHTPNQGRSAQEGAKLQRMGVKPGVPDIFVAIPFNSLFEEGINCNPFAVGSYSGLFIELKSEKGNLSDSQKEMIYNLEGRGYMCCTANSLEKAKEIIKKWYGVLMK